MTRSGGRGGGFRRRAGYPARSDRDDTAALEALDAIGIGDMERGGKPRDYLDRLPLPAPLGGGELLFSPTEPVDPLDCARWPSSPYCGGNPFGDGFLGLDVGVSLDRCEQILSFEPTLGWLRLPAFEIGRRSGDPSCAPPPPPPMGRPPIPAPSLYWESPIGGQRDCLYLVQVAVNADAFGAGPGYSITAEYAVWGPIYGYQLNLFPSETYHGFPPYAGYLTAPWFNPGGLLCHGAAIATALQELPRSPSFLRTARGLTNVSGALDGLGDYALRDIKVTIQAQIFPEDYYTSKRDAFSFGTADWGFWNAQQLLYSSIQSLRPNCRPIDSRPPRFPRRYNRNPPDMCNCKQLENSLKRIERVLGIPQLYSGGHSGWRVPQKLAGTNTQDTETLDNYATLLNWLIGEIRDSLGDTKYKITIEDANLVQEGDQEVSVEIPNLSEGQAEILGLLLQMSATLNANFAATNHSLIQSGEATLAATRSALEVQEIADFLGYKTQEKAVDVPLMFTPDKNDPSEFLKPSQAKITYMQVDDKNDLSIKLAVLEQAAAIIRGVFAQRADIASLVAMDAEIKEAVNDRSDVDQVMEQIEDGFTVFDLENPERNPYGKPYSQRPRIVIKSRGGWTYGQNNNGNP